MKILAIHSYTDGKVGAPVDLWRIYRPLNELSKHTDWQIDHASSIIKGLNKDTKPEDFTEGFIEQTAKELGEYDAIMVSYWNLSPILFSYLMVVSNKHGTKIIVDIDDDVFDIPYYNPIWSKVTPQEIDEYKKIVSIAPFVTTTNEHLANKIRNNNKNAKVFVLPNYISDDYRHPSFNNKHLTIGYFGGSSHYRDLHRSGLLPALEKLMHQNKDIRFQCVGQPIDHYLPRARTSVREAVNGVLWTDELFPTLNFDIAVIPLQDDEFAKSKSNIKWQESTRMGASVIASDVGPYKDLKDVAILVPNTQEAWYIGLTQLLNPSYRSNQLKRATKLLKANWRLEDNWDKYKVMFQEATNANHQTKQ